MLMLVAKLIELAAAEAARRRRLQRRRRLDRAARTRWCEQRRQLGGLRLRARRSRSAGRERRMEPALRARRADAATCRSSCCAPTSNASAANLPRPPRATRATRCSRGDASRAKSSSPPSIATIRLETLLLQLFRGAGVAGLAAMPAHCAVRARATSRDPCSRCRAAKSKPPRARRSLQWIEDP